MSIPFSTQSDSCDPSAWNRDGNAMCSLLRSGDVDYLDGQSFPSI